MSFARFGETNSRNIFKPAGETVFCYVIILLETFHSRSRMVIEENSRSLLFPASNPADMSPEDILHTE